MLKRSRYQSGLTLIEVLVALAIIAIAMTAIIKAAAQHIKSTSHLQDKAIAQWVANNVVAKAKLDLIQLPEAPEKMKQVENMLGQDWYWQADQMATANQHVLKVLVEVYDQKDPDEDVDSIASLTGYKYHVKER